MVGRREAGPSVARRDTCDVSPSLVVCDRRPRKAAEVGRCRSQPFEPAAPNEAARKRTWSRCPEPASTAPPTRSCSHLVALPRAGEHSTADSDLFGVACLMGYGAPFNADQQPQLTRPQRLGDRFRAPRSGSLAEADCGRRRGHLPSPPAGLGWPMAARTGTASTSLGRHSRSTTMPSVRGWSGGVNRGTRGSIDACG